MQLLQDLAADSDVSQASTATTLSPYTTEMRKSATKGTRVALKETFASLDLDNGGFDELFNELSILRKLRHPNIVHLLGTYESATLERGFLVTIYAENGSLSKHFKKPFREVTFKQRLKWTLDIAYALSYVACSLRALGSARSNLTAN